MCLCANAASFKKDHRATGLRSCFVSPSFFPCLPVLPNPLCHAENALSTSVGPGVLLTRARATCRTQARRVFSFFLPFFSVLGGFILCLVFARFSAAKRAYAVLCCQCGPLSCWTCRRTFGCFSCAPYESEGDVLFLLFLGFFWSFLRLLFIVRLWDFVPCFVYGVGRSVRFGRFARFGRFLGNPSTVSRPICIPQLLHTSHFLCLFPASWLSRSWVQS